MRRTFTNTILSALLSATATAQGTVPSVVSTAPASQELRAPRDTTLEILFDEPMDPTSVDERCVRVFGRWSGPATLSFEWQDSNTRLVLQPADRFSAGEMVTVYAARTLRSAAGENLSRGHSWQFWILALPAPFDFVPGASASTRRPGEGLVRSYGGYGGDLNGDGFSDLAVTNELSDDLRIFYNDGLGNYSDFEIVPLLDGGGPSANEGADFNHDGAVDLVVGNAFADATMVLLGDGDGGFEEFVPYTTAAGVRAVGVLDLDGDACEDIVSACKTGDRLAILRGDGSGVFATPELRETPGNGDSALAVGDANGDGLLDLFLASDPGGDVQLFLGDGEGDLIWSDSVDASGRPWVLASGDLNGDGLCDVVTAGGYANTVAVILATPNGNMATAIPLGAGSLTVSVDLGDLDGDGDLDIVASNLFGSSWTLYANDGNGNFGDRLEIRAPQAGSCAILHDRDEDGVLDLTLVDERADELLFFEHASEDSTTRTDLQPRIHWSGPNPLDLQEPEATIQLSVEVAGVHRLELFDVRGRRVAELLNRRLDTGEQALNWSEFDAALLPNGSAVYWLRLSGPMGSDSHKVVLLR